MEKKLDNKFLNVKYDSQSIKQKMDVYLPFNNKESNPAFVFFHGGAWCMGDKSDNQYEPFLKLLSKGYIVVSVGYRLTNEASFPAQIYDAKTAIRCLKSRAEEFHIDKKRIAVAGESAGAYIALMLAVTSGTDNFENLSTGHSDEDSSISCAFSLYAPTDLGKFNEQMRQLGINIFFDENSSTSFIAKFLGKPISKINQAELDKTNPVKYITKDIPPILLQHGIADRTVPYLQSQEFYDRAVEIAGKDRVILELFPKTDHGDSQFKNSKNLNRIESFLAENIY